MTDGVIFGKALTRTFTPDDGRDYVIIPSQVPAIYLFSSYPAMADARNGTGAFATVSYWTHSATNATRTYTLPAVDDPNPTSNVSSVQYWEVINYILDTGEQQQTKIREIWFDRADAAESVPGTTLTDIKEVWPGVVSYITDAQINQFLPIAEFTMRQELKGRGYDWGKIINLTDAKYALAYKTIEAMAASQVVKGAADKFMWMVKYFNDLYSKAMAALKLPYDADQDGVPDSETKTSNNTIMVTR